MGEDVVQVLGQAQALLVNPPLALVGLGPGPLRCLLPPSADHLRHRQHDHQPSRDQGQVEEVGIGPRVEVVGDHEAHETGRRQRPRLPSLPGLDGGEKGDGHAHEDGPVGVAEADVDVGGGDTDGYRGEGPPVPHGQRCRTGQDEHQGESVDRLAVGLVVGRPEGPHDLEQGDAGGGEPHRGGRVRSHTGKVCPTAARVVPPGEQRALLPGAYVRQRIPVSQETATTADVSASTMTSAGSAWQPPPMAAPDSAAEGWTR